MATDKECIKLLIDAIENKSTIPKRNVNYSMLVKNGKSAIQICLSNDDSGEPLACETITTETLLYLLKNI